MLDSLINKVTGFQAGKFIKKRLQHRFFSCNVYEIFKNTYFEEHLEETASDRPDRVQLALSLSKKITQLSHKTHQKRV